MRFIDFAHVPNTYQDYFYEALDRGDLGQKVFPTALFLNEQTKPPVAETGGKR